MALLGSGKIRFRGVVFADVFDDVLVDPLPGPSRWAQPALRGRELL
jgi:hypothetical protein